MKKNERNEMKRNEIDEMRWDETAQDEKKLS